MTTKRCINCREPIWNNLYVELDETVRCDTCGTIQIDLSVGNY